MGPGAREALQVQLVPWDLEALQDQTAQVHHCVLSRPENPEEKN